MNVLICSLASEKFHGEVLSLLGGRGGGSYAGGGGGSEGHGEAGLGCASSRSGYGSGGGGYGGGGGGIGGFGGGRGRGGGVGGRPCAAATVATPRLLGGGADAGGNGGGGLGGGFGGGFKSGEQGGGGGAGGGGYGGGGGCGGGDAGGGISVPTPYAAMRRSQETAPRSSNTTPVTATKASPASTRLPFPTGACRRSSTSPTEEAVTRTSSTKASTCYRPEPEEEPQAGMAAVAAVAVATVSDLEEDAMAAPEDSASVVEDSEANLAVPLAEVVLAAALPASVQRLIAVQRILEYD